MGRWDGIDGQDTPYDQSIYNGPIYDSVIQEQQSPTRDFLQIAGPGTVRPARGAQVGDYLGYEPDGTSGWVRCYYHLQDTLLCEDTPGCCESGCCPKDWTMMGGLYALIVIVALIVVVSLIVGILCYLMSKSRQKKEDKMQNAYAYSQYGGSQVGINGGPYPYGTYPQYTPYVAPKY